MEKSYLKKTLDEITECLNGNYLFGVGDFLETILIAYIARGHVLIEGPPGTAKTLSAKLIAKVLSKSFNRIQFTSDMLPGDILGAHIFSPTANAFEFIKGPIFADFILADEINRTPPRTQSALLEVMEEKQVTSEGKQFKLADDFFVLATQNPQDFEGTFPLPEVQLDRFLFKLATSHSSSEVETEILEKIIKGELPPNYDRLSKIDFDWELIDKEVSAVNVDRSILEYVTNILKATRNNPKLLDGSSIRGGIALVKCSRILAILRGRDFVVPDDIKTLAIPTLVHRVKLSPDALMGNILESDVIREIVSKVPFPE